ncbi:MAG: TRAP transporter permease, partial [Hydrogenophaga sp.]|nr:TRAP transporter permease [Hydrogenophaga sp.]
DWTDTLWIVFKALVAIGMWGAGAIGYLIGRLNVVERIVAVVSASFLVVALPLTDEIGLGAVAVFVAWHYWRTRQQRALSAAR